jgi:hypothetical protein
VRCAFKKELRQDYENARFVEIDLGQRMLKIYGGSDYYATKCIVMKFCFICLLGVIMNPSLYFKLGTYLLFSGF